MPLGCCPRSNTFLFFKLAIFLEAYSSETFAFTESHVIDLHDATWYLYFLDLAIEKAPRSNNFELTSFPERHVFQPCTVFKGAVS